MPVAPDTITVGQCSPSGGDASYTLPADARQFWIQSTADVGFKGTTGSTVFPLQLEEVYGPFSARGLQGKDLVFNGTATVSILVETGLGN
jgi:hypothetical protein